MKSISLLSLCIVLLLAGCTGRDVRNINSIARAEDPGAGRGWRGRAIRSRS